MAGKRLDVLSPRPKKDGGTYWHRVGTAWEGEKGISITFDSLPLPDKEGQVRVSLFEPRESQGAGTERKKANAEPKASAETYDDEVPF
jgi:hypothetical protein